VTPRTKQQFFHDMQSNKPFTGVWMDKTGTIAVMLSRPRDLATDASGMMDWFSYDIVASESTLSIRVDVASSHWPAFHARWDSRYSALVTEDIMSSDSSSAYSNVQSALDQWQRPGHGAQTDDITRGDDLVAPEDPHAARPSDSIWNTGPLGSEFLPLETPMVLFLDDTTQHDPDMPYAIEVVARSEHKRRRHACTALQHVDVLHIYLDPEAYEQDDPLVTHRLSSFFQRYYHTAAAAQA